MKLNRNHLMLILACVLMLIAGTRFWSQAAQQRANTAASSRVSQAGQRITTTSPASPGAGPMKDMDPFEGLGLTPDQRKKVDALLADSTETRVVPDGHGHINKQVRIHLSKEKLKAILTPSQWKKWEEKTPHGRIVRKIG